MKHDETAFIRIVNYLAIAICLAAILVGIFGDRL